MPFALSKTVSVFDVVYVNGGGVKVDEHCNYRLFVWERYVDVVLFSFLFLPFQKVIWVLLCMRRLGKLMFSYTEKCLGLYK